MLDMCLQQPLGESRSRPGIAVLWDHIRKSASGALFTFEAGFWKISQCMHTSDFLSTLAGNGHKHTQGPPSRAYIPAL
jgi:hypothetical protein